MAQFDVYSTSVESIIGWIKSGEIAIPEIQRPSVTPFMIRNGYRDGCGWWVKDENR